MTSHELSSPKLWNYDVFLSFRGEDTRNSFTGHLHAALQDRGFDAFMDEDNLKRGGEIKPELSRAIEESRISVIVFSKSYAESRWCLDELVRIMECRGRFGQQVLPIFYHVDPSHVRNQKGCLAQAFQKHEDGILKENDDKEREAKKERVKQWREALTGAGDLSGYHLKKGSEAKLIKKIVEDIRGLLPSTDELDVAKYPVGIYSRVQPIISDLSSCGKNDVKIVGIWGMGGLDKTAFTTKKDYGKEEREAQWAAAQRTLHGLQPPETNNLFNEKNSYRELFEIAELAKRRAEVARLRELHTLKGHVESVVKLKGLDIDAIQQHYTV